MTRISYDRGELEDLNFALSGVLQPELGYLVDKFKEDARVNPLGDTNSLYDFINWTEEIKSLCKNI